MELFITFCVLNVVNVILQTIKSIVTVNCGKYPAAAMNAIAFGLYQVILVYAVCDLPLFVKVVVVAAANFIGVFITKYFQEKLRKDKLWRVEMAVPAGEIQNICNDAKLENISFNYIPTGKYFSFNCFCRTQEESAKVKKIVKKYGVKYFVTESKVL